MTVESQPLPVGPRFRYPRRALATLAVAILVGPLLGILVAVAVDGIAGMASSDQASGASVPEALFRLLVPGYLIGAPIAAVAGLVAAGHVARHGEIGALRTAAIAFLTPLVPLMIIGGPVGVLFGLFYGIPAAVAALVLRAVGMVAWRRLRGAAA